MNTIQVAYTRGDRATQPGGIIIRQKDNGEFVVHNFNRAYGSLTPVEFFWGGYTRDLARAVEIFNEKKDRRRLELTTAEEIQKEMPVEN